MRAGRSAARRGPRLRRGERETGPREVSCRQNVQKGLATSLQTLSQHFRQSQKDYLGKIRERQTGALWDEPLKARVALPCV